MTAVRTYSFKITVNVDPDQPGDDDPEWIADASWGTLSNEYGYRCTFDSIEELVETTSL